MYKKLIRLEFDSAKKILNKFINNDKNIELIYNAAKLLVSTFQNKGKVISCGNGGSHCDAMHFSEELVGKYRKKRIGLPALAISDSSYITCVGNDYNYETIFSRYIDTFGCANDILLVISTSGNSTNVIKAIESAKIKKMKIITLTGGNGGKIKGMSDLEIIVPYFNYSDRIQEMHIKIIHIIIYIVEKKMIKNFL